MSKDFVQRANKWLAKQNNIIRVPGQWGLEPLHWWKTEKDVRLATRKIREVAANHRGQKIFIDGGFNRGKVMRHFISHLPDFGFYGFEPNDQFRTVAEQLTASYPDNVLSLSFNAITTKNGPVSFFREGPSTGVHQSEGSTIMPGRLLSTTDYEHPHTVEGVDFSNWIADTYERHTINGNTPFIVSKLDVEGAEVPVLERMIAQGTIEKVKFLIVEFHGRMIEDPQERAECTRSETRVKEYLKAKHIPILEWF